MTAACCARCALPLPAGEVCGHCLQHAPVIDSVTARFAYQEPLRSVLIGFKHQQRWPDARVLADLMLQVPPPQTQGLLLVPVPLHPLRVKARGYNQSAELCRRLGRQLSLTVDPYGLQRILPTPPQQQLDRTARLRNLKQAFVADRERVIGRDILLIDDVMTTGATLDAAATALKSAGATSVHGWVVARAL